MILALADRNDPAAAPLIVKAARSGGESVRVLAMRALLRLDEAAAAPVLLDAAMESNAAVSQAARTAIDELQGDAIDQLIANRVAVRRGANS